MQIHLVWPQTHYTSIRTFRKPHLKTVAHAAGAGEGTLDKCVNALWKLLLLCIIISIIISAAPVTRQSHHINHNEKENYRKSIYANRTNGCSWYMLKRKMGNTTTYNTLVLNAFLSTGEAVKHFFHTIHSVSRSWNLCYWPFSIGSIYLIFLYTLL